MDLYFRKTGIGPPLIILHGLFGSSDNWYSISKALFDSFTVYCPDQRNHGRSPHDKHHDYDVLAEDLLHFIKQNNISDPCVIGHSMGGKALMLFALRYPDLIKKMILVDISPRSYKSLLEAEPHTLELLNIMNALLSVDLKNIKRREEADEQLSIFLQDKNLRAFLLKNLILKDGTFKWTFNLDVLHQNLPKMMDGLDPKIIGEKKCLTRALFIKGEKSEYITAKDSDTISKYFPNSGIHTISDAGHWVHAEQPAEFISVVRRFLLNE